MNDTNTNTAIPAAEPPRPPGRRLLNTPGRRWIAAGAAALALSVAGVSAGLAATSSSPSTSQAPTAAGPAGGFGATAGTSNARSAPASGGSIGTVATASTTGFTLTTSGGQTVTVVEGTSTTYLKGTAPASASDVTAGAPVLVLGVTNSMSITASQVIVQPLSASSSAAAAVVPFQRGASTTSKSVGQIPAGYTEGSGTIVSGSAAESATKAALAAYPGGVVDRVVQLSSGEYEVHNIGVNWPHHVFVSQSFQVMGAN